jgi:hypothetical protein
MQDDPPSALIGDVREKVAAEVCSWPIAAIQASEQTEISFLERISHELKPAYQIDSALEPRKISRSESTTKIKKNMGNTNPSSARLPHQRSGFIQSCHWQ